MPEPVFLLLLMFMTGLGVWVFLAQLHGKRPALPRLRLPGLRLPRLPGRRRPKRVRERAPRDEYELEDEDAGRFAPGQSPFRAAPAPAGTLLQSVPVYEDEDDYDDADDLLPANQVDFFAADRSEATAGPLRTVSLAAADEPPAVYETPNLAPGAPVPEASPLVEVAAAAEPDPNDILAFFEKPAATTHLPEILRDAIEDVSVTDLLAEARQVRALFQSGKESA
jgi:hypothetical protein